MPPLRLEMKCTMTNDQLNGMDLVLCHCWHYKYSNATASRHVQSLDILDRTCTLATAHALPYVLSNKAWAHMLGYIKNKL